MTNKIVVVGSYNVDITLQTERFPEAGETVLGKSITFSHGGKGANQAVAAARAGANVSFIARVGDDDYGRKAVEDLKKEQINTDGIIWDSSAPTGMASITVNDQGENCIVAVSGANAHLSSQDIDQHKNLIHAADVLLIQLETPLPTIEKAIQIAHEKKVCVILDPAPAQKIKPEILSMVSLITPNKGETELLTGRKISDENSLKKAANHLLSMGIKVVIITLGKEGIYLATHEEHKKIPACQVRTIDSTGAGDVFNGVLAARYLPDKSHLVKTAVYAVAASSLSVTKKGAQTAIPMSCEIDQFMEESIRKNVLPDVS
ncbi:ribokinase [Fidelibacter multiformis]|uniref:ribokinase n=1 Tax=Fidelibacter multiformis TaxID=3377529 RepID=UPI0037DD8043